MSGIDSTGERDRPEDEVDVLVEDEPDRAVDWRQETTDEELDHELTDRADETPDTEPELSDEELDQLLTEPADDTDAEAEPAEQTEIELAEAEAELQRERELREKELKQTISNELDDAAKSALLTVADVATSSWSDPVSAVVTIAGATVEAGRVGESLQRAWEAKQALDEFREGSIY
jgi:hypothetical protein